MDYLNTINHASAHDFLPKLPDGSVDLIYIDPPFNTKIDQTRVYHKFESCDEGTRSYGDSKGTLTPIVQRSFSDSFEDYTGFLEPLLVQSHRILKPTGSIYVHVDTREQVAVRVLLSHIFGPENFLNELIWHWDYGGKSKRRWPQKHNNIYWYSKNPKLYHFDISEADRLEYIAPKLAGAVKAAQGKVPTDTFAEKTYLDQSESTASPNPSDSQIVRTNPTTTIVPDSDCALESKGDVIWHTIVCGKERLHYPTQKPVKFIEQLVKTSCPKGGVVLDFFGGSGTTGAAAKLNGRNYILCDESEEAVKVMRQRLEVDAKA